MYTVETVYGQVKYNFNYKNMALLNHPRNTGNIKHKKSIHKTTPIRGNLTPLSYLYIAGQTLP